MINLEKYYVYKHVNPNGEVFYVGSNHRAGDPNRAYNFIQRTSLWKELMQDGFTVEIVKYFKDKKECVAYEHELIHYYHDLGQALASLEDRRGKRNGRYGSTWIEGTHPMLNSQGGFYNKKHNEKTKLSIRTSNPNRHSINQYDINGNFIRSYLSLREVEEITGFNRKTISKRCKDNKSYKNYYWRYGSSNSYN